MSTHKEEELLTRRIIKKLSGQFFIEREATGVHLIDGSMVRVDLLLKPKQVAIDMGFCADVFGIEVKTPDNQKNAGYKKLFNCIKQASTYSDSVFSGDIPEFILIYPDVETSLACYNPPSPTSPYFERFETYRRAAVTVIRTLMHKFCVGDVVETHLGSISFRFSNATYYDTKAGRKTYSVKVPRRIASKKLSFEKYKGQVNNQWYGTG